MGGLCRGARWHCRHHIRCSLGKRRPMGFHWSRVHSSSPVFFGQPFNALCISLFTLLLSNNKAVLFISAYFFFVLSTVAAAPPSIAAIRTLSIHNPLLQIRLAPRGSSCFRPCNTPPMIVSCQYGVQTADRLLDTAFSPAASARLDHVNSVVVGFTVNGWNVYPPPHPSFVEQGKFLRRPVGEKARSHAWGTYCEAGRMRVAR